MHLFISAYYNDYSSLILIFFHFENCKTEFSLKKIKSSMQEIHSKLIQQFTDICMHKYTSKWKKTVELLSWGYDRHVINLLYLYTYIFFFFLERKVHGAMFILIVPMLHLFLILWDTSGKERTFDLNGKRFLPVSFCFSTTI